MHVVALEDRRAKKAAQRSLFDARAAVEALLNAQREKLSRVWRDLQSEVGARKLDRAWSMIATAAGGGSGLVVSKETPFGTA